MVDKALDKANEKVQKVFDEVKEGQSQDAPVELPGTHQKRDKDSGEVGEKIPGDTGRRDDIPNPGAPPSPQ